MEHFFWKELPVIDGKFTIRQLLSTYLIEKIQGVFNLDSEIIAFTNVPCTKIFILKFQKDEEIFVVQDYYYIEEMFNNGKNFNFTSHSIEYTEWHDGQRYSNVESYTRDKLLELNMVPRELIEGLRMRRDDGKIVIYTGETVKTDS
ncbi:hypothetical protein EB118_04030 [bacterium]|nr:hypothetical protein [Actinomycetota bacterium]NDG29255.1 hypothetical protein [bacterium]